jgi:uncharacterized membrane protein
LQAAIAAVRAEPASYQSTDWKRISAPYHPQLWIDPSPIIGLFRTVAITESDGKKRDWHSSAEFSNAENWRIIFLRTRHAESEAEDWDERPNRLTPIERRTLELEQCENTREHSENPTKQVTTMHKQRIAISMYSIGMIALGILSVISKDFAYSWQPVPEFHPGREALAVTCGLFMIAASVALLFRSTAAIAARAMFLFLLAWMSLKIPALFVAPQIEGVWLGLGELGMLFAGGWILFARLSRLDDTPYVGRFCGQRGIRFAQILFGLAVIPVGVGHIVFFNITTSPVSSWLPFWISLAWITGAGQIACGLGIFFSVLPQMAAYIETGMLALFGFLVWGPDTWFAATPKMVGSPAGPRFPLTAFLITWIIGASALLIAKNSASNDFSLKNSARKQGKKHLLQ